MNEEDKDNMFYCSFVSIHYIICECGETFPTEEDLKLHLEKEHPHKKEIKEFKCGVCEKSYSTEEECIKHYEENHVKLELDFSDVEDQDDYSDDDELETGIEAKVVEKVICESCGVTYTSCSEHVCIPEADPLEPWEPKTRKKKKTKSPKNTVCELCGKKYTSAAALRYHQRVHTGERPYKCTMCEKSFTMPLFLRIHVRTHTGEKPYECSHCPKAFGNKAAVMRHERVHTGEKPYKCPKCGKAFSQSNSMKIHYSTVHLKMPTPYKSKKRKQQEQERTSKKRSNDRNPSTYNVLNAVKSITSGSDVFLKVQDLQNVEVKSENEFAEATLYDEDGNELKYEVVYTQ